MRGIEKETAQHIINARFVLFVGNSYCHQKTEDVKCAHKVNNLILEKKWGADQLRKFLLRKKDRRYKIGRTPLG